MEFRFEDILKNIIPGMITCFGLSIFFLSNYSYTDIQKTISSDIKEYSEIILVLLLVCCYLVGYCVDALSSVLEHYCIYAIFGTPTLKLLKGKGRRIFLSNYTEVLQNIKRKYFLTVTNFILDKKRVYSYSNMQIP
jgi:hypothetical protein